VIVDVANPNAPSLLGRTITDGPFGITVGGNLAFLADNTGGLVIVDVSVASSPQIVGGDPALEELRVILVRDQTLFTQRSSAGVENGLYVVDITAPATPTVLGRFTTNSTEDVFLDGQHLYLTGTDGLVVITASATPALVTSFDTNLGPNPQTVAVRGDHVYVGTTDDEIVVLEKVFE
jgi:hypothetical protein